MNDAPTRVILVTGLSGAGRLSILRALEDLGYEAIDNLPTNAIESVVTGGPARRIAIGADVRSRGFDPDALVDVLRRLRDDPALRAELVFASADDAALLRRYTETRRRHPMAPGGRVTDGIAAERTLTAPLHSAADFVLDTSDLAIPALRQWVDRLFGSESDLAPKAGLSVSVMSFGYPGGLPREADLVLDARFLRNPHYVPTLRPLTGRDAPVAEYVAEDPDFATFYDQIVGMLTLVLPRFVQEGKKYATVAIGCTGGRHRSVTIVERLGSHLAAQGWRVSVNHRELARAEEQAHMPARQTARTVVEDLPGEPPAPDLPQPATATSQPDLRSDTTP
jgi:UPF0042 nucleotide-binding protein